MITMINYPGEEVRHFSCPISIAWLLGASCARRVHGGEKGGYCSGGVLLLRAE
jgi:hypothetical protein